MDMQLQATSTQQCPYIINQVVGHPQQIKQQHMAQVIAGETLDVCTGHLSTVNLTCHELADLELIWKITCVSACMPEPLTLFRQSASPL